MVEFLSTGNEYFIAPVPSSEELKKFRQLPIGSSLEMYATKISVRAIYAVLYITAV